MALGRRNGLSRAFLLAGAIALLGAALALAPRGWPRGQRAAEQAALSAASPFSRLAGGFRRLGSRVWVPLFEGDRLRSENRLLREEIARIQLESADERRQLDSARSRLALSEIPDGLGLKCVAASVLAIGPLPPARTLIIGRGRSSGIEPDMAVLAPPGLAGVVRRASESQALVQLLVEKRSEWGAAAGESKCPGVVRGTGEWDHLLFYFENAAGQAAPGDRVWTSGVSGSLFPSGLPIGEVTAIRVEKDGRLTADVKPLAPMNALEEVYVVLSPPRKPSEEMLRAP